MSRSKIRTSTISEMCALVVDCPHFTPRWTAVGKVVIRNQNIRNGRLDLSTPSFTDEEDFRRRIRRAKPQAGDIIITREAPMGEVCLVPNDLDCCLGQRQVLLRPKPEVDSRYLHIALQSDFVRRQIFWNEGTGSTVSNIRIPVLEALEIPRWPNREESIAAVVGSIDDKIELNRRMNETLEAQARALFRDWFVDFGPVKANMAGAAPYLAPDLWSLFPDRLDDDGVPEGWKWIPASKLFEIRIGRTPPRKQTEHFVDGAEGVPWLSIKTMGGGDVYIFDTEESLTPESVERFNVPSVRKGTVLLSFKLTVGRVAIAGCDMTTNEAIAHFNETPTSPPSAFTYSFLKQFDYQRLGSTSSIATAVNSQTIKSIEFPCPGDCLLKAFDELAAPLLEKIKSNTSESRTLAQIRDLLLPKLMSGEIRVGDVECELESA